MCPCKRTLLASAFAGIGAAIGVDTARAVNLSPDGRGQVLLYPYYTVNQNQDTYFSVGKGRSRVPK